MGRAQVPAQAVPVAMQVRSVVAVRAFDVDLMLDPPGR
jgi:hypothetical protein